MYVFQKRFCGLIVDFAENHKGMDVDCEFLKTVIGDYGNEV